MKHVKGRMVLYCLAFKRPLSRHHVIEYIIMPNSSLECINSGLPMSITVLCTQSKLSRLEGLERNKKTILRATE